MNSKAKFERMRFLAEKRRILRHDLKQDVHALKDDLAPGKLLGRAQRQAEQVALDVTDQAVREAKTAAHLASDTARKHPFLLALGGVAAFFLFKPVKELIATSFDDIEDGED